MTTMTMAMMMTIGSFPPTAIETFLYACIAHAVIARLTSQSIFKWYKL